MSSAFVFPGGIADDGETDARTTAARELFEEAGVLLSDKPISEDERSAWRDAVNDDGASLDALLTAAGASLAVGGLHYFAHWITPTIEKRRYSAKFYIAELPAGQTPSFDNRETVDEVWVTPDEALERAGELRLPPPQVRTFYDMRDAAQRGWQALVDQAVAREKCAFPILPRLCQQDKGFALLLPWDPDYISKGTGEMVAISSDHPLCTGPSRFVLEDTTWKNIDAPPSTQQD
jgi:8-oxo-dGTP pyrophosphatase MutT (NUDIX family)